MNGVPETAWRSYVAFIDRTVADVGHRYRWILEREDLRQAGMVALVEVLRQFDGRERTFDGYLRLRVRGAIIDAARHEARRHVRDTVGLQDGPWAFGQRPGARYRPSDASPVDALAIDPDPDIEAGVVCTPWRGGRRSMESEVMYRDFVRSLRARLAALETRERAAIQACDLDQLSLARAALRLGISRAGVHRARQRALDQLRGEWDGAAEPPATAVAGGAVRGARTARRDGPTAERG